MASVPCGDRITSKPMLNFLRGKKERKVFVVGLDCGDPGLVFDHWRQDLPNFRRLIEQGAYGQLSSTIPCITVPAWSSMTSSQDPGRLGFYGFRNRADYSYDNMTIATGASVKEPRVWDLLGEAGKQVVVVGVPQTYPVKPVNGYLISSFLTPSTQRQYTYPHEFRNEVDQLLGGRPYEVDVPQFRTDNKEFLLKQIYEMTEKRFIVLKDLLKNKPWDFFMFVEMGVDRIQHGLWKYADSAHPKYEPGSPYENAIKDYYRYIDQELGEMLSALDDNAVILVVSDHGAKRMDGGICINEWLRREGFLVLKEDPIREGTRPIPFEKVEVDWEKTTAWGAGGYYARIFLNVQGREPDGLIRKADYEKVRDEVAGAIEAIPDERGNPIATTCYRPEDIYQQVRNIPPDLIVYLGDLHWRSVGSFGFDSIYTFENDTGPDDANHAQDGMIIYYDPRQPLRAQQLSGLQLMDFAPTVLKLMGQPIPETMQGQVIEL
jgi:predicted AlkP superfamily phosphohydrolase/phosphomutase